MNAIDHANMHAKALNKNFGKFTEMAEFIVDHGGKDGSSIVTEESKPSIALDFSVLMSMGEEMTKHKHLMTGIIIGVVGTAGIIIAYKLIKKKEERA